MENQVKRLVGYLNYFGRAKFHNFNFDDDRVDFATIEIIMDDKLRDGLEKEINRLLCIENGSNAYMRFIALERLTSEGKYKYAAEIVPHDFVPRHLWAEVSEEYLRRLPKVISNYRHKNPSKGRR